MADRIQLMIGTSGYFSGKLAVELAHLIGFKSVAMEFPLIVFDKSAASDSLLFVIKEGMNEGREEGYSVEGNTVNITIAPTEEAVDAAYNHVVEHFNELAKDFGRSGHEQARPEGFTSAKTIAIETFDKRYSKGLESLFDRDFILFDDNNDLLSDRLDAKILMRESYSREQVAAACHIAARLGLETTAIVYPITCTEETAWNVFAFRDASQCSLILEDSSILNSGKRRFICAGNGSELVEFSSVLCETFPLQKPGSRWVDILNDIRDGLCMQTVDGQLAYLEMMKEKISPDTACYFSPKIREVSEDVLKSYAPAKFSGYKDLKKVHEKEYDIPWEVDVCKALLDEKLWPMVKAGDKLEIRAVLSEDKDIRGQLSREFRALAEGKGAELTGVSVICAYKQGFSWLEEEVMPGIANKGKTEKIEIAFKPFLAPGVTDWADEDGAMPSYNNLSANDPNKWYDLPIRYLQELYPIDDILSSGLGIERDNITFVEYSGSEDITYLVKAYSKEGVICEEKYKAVHSERNYMDFYPGMGKVHPSTGHIRVSVNGKEIISERIPTDLELVWQIYQEDILPYCHSYCQEKTGGKPGLGHQPFFAQMRLDLMISEPNEKLSCREDLISSLDTFHEDLYFTGLDFFKLYGNSTAGAIFDAPGLILPVIIKRPGKPYFKFTLYDQYGLEPRIDFGSESVKSMFKKEDIDITISSLRYNAGKLSPVIRGEGPAGLTGPFKSYVRLLQERKLNVEKRLTGIEEMHFEVFEDVEDEKQEFFTVKVQPAPDIPKDLSIDKIDILEDTLIGYDEYVKIFEQLKRVPGLNVYTAAESYLGRDIHAIEFLTDYRGYVSRTKLINNNPVLFINARHHANEVSSTNAAFMLIKELLTRESYKGLTKDLNLIVVPFANADGGAIHYELQKDNPTWIFHIARFNAIGREFYHEYFKDETLHTEALCATRVWRNWLPDIIVDNHGVPTHEWAQQFSGYTSPSYKGFWLPRSLLYGCFWTIKEEEWSSNIPVAKKMEDLIADVMAADPEIRGWNLEWQERFAKYATKWMPRLFPANYFKDMVNVWVPFNFDINHRYPSVRYPWITTVAYTSEVIDETAQGSFLNLVARVHMMHDIEVINMMRRSKSIFIDSNTEREGGSSQTYFRQRPIIAI
ncbi:MAG: M14 family metallopeptidase [Treponema sp.]|nr:M14 family metallopeptidase [Treponema sp.]